MRVALVFHKDPSGDPGSIDLIRLRAISSGLLNRGIETDIFAPVSRPSVLDLGIRVYGVDKLKDSKCYDIIKTCYHDSIRLIRSQNGKIVSRIVRVVDKTYPERDERFRSRLLECQDLILEKAHTVVFNNEENRSRWINLYGSRNKTALVPTGCPRSIPNPGVNPYNANKKVILFLGSLAAPRMIAMLNELATRVVDIAEVHVVGLNKAMMYGGAEMDLNPLIISHGEKRENQTWDYIYHAHIGLALATGIHPFDNDISKIYSYLRGGLPTLSEEPILNNKMILDLAYGSEFEHGDIDSLVFHCRKLSQNAPLAKKTLVMDYMAREHSWDERVDRYIRLFGNILEEHN